MADDRKPPNADLAAVAQGLCWADMPDGRCACFPAVCVATDPRYPYLHRARRALAADPVRQLLLDDCERMMLGHEIMGNAGSAQYYRDILARAAAQVQS